MPSIITTAVQSAFLKAAANLTAQLATRYKQDQPRPLDWLSMTEFAIFGLIQAQLNSWWQRYLEESFPTHRNENTSLRDNDQTIEKNATSKRGTGIDWLHVFAKLILDQTLGLFIMNTTFLVYTNVARVETWFQVTEVVQRRIWHIIRTGWKIWPVVSLCNFLWVPVEYRVVVASCVGFGWNIFLTIVALTK